MTHTLVSASFVVKRIKNRKSHHRAFVYAHERSWLANSRSHLDRLRPLSFILWVWVFTELLDWNLPPGPHGILYIQGEHVYIFVTVRLILFRPHFDFSKVVDHILYYLGKIWQCICSEKKAFYLNAGWWRNTVVETWSSIRRYGHTGLFIFGVSKLQSWRRIHHQFGGGRIYIMHIVHLSATDVIFSYGVMCGVQ